MGEQVEQGMVKKLGTLDVWALGVGIVVCGQYFGWNLGLVGNGPVAMLLASLFVCLLFVAWLLALPELSVAMPYADGPLEYGRRAGGPGLGFGMAWSMFLAMPIRGHRDGHRGGPLRRLSFQPDCPVSDSGSVGRSGDRRSLLLAASVGREGTGLGPCRHDLRRPRRADDLLGRRRQQLLLGAGLARVGPPRGEGMEGRG